MNEIDGRLSPLHVRENGKAICQLSGEQASLADILDFLPDLNAYGFRTWTRWGKITDSEHNRLRAELQNPNCIGGLSPATLERLAGWLSSFDRSLRWKQDSYALKHTFERETRTYMMNGAFIVGVLMAGFEIKIAGPNALIKAQRPAQ